MRNILILLLTPFILSACSSLSIEDCAVTDWQQRGYEEAKRGFNLKQYDEYAQECKDIGGVIPSKAKYSTGHYKGTQEFCTVLSGYSYGKSGGYYSQSCSDWNLDVTDFMTGYRAGREYYKTEKEIDEALEELDDHRTGMEDAQYKIQYNTEKLAKPELTQQERNNIKIEIQKQKSRYNDFLRSEGRYIEKVEQSKRDLEYVILKHKRLNYCDYKGCFE